VREITAEGKEKYCEALERQTRTKEHISLIDQSVSEIESLSNWKSKHYGDSPSLHEKEYGEMGTLINQSNQRVSL
jgi:hypothetical protein